MFTLTDYLILVVFKSDLDRFTDVTRITCRQAAENKQNFTTGVTRHVSTNTAAAAATMIPTQLSKLDDVFFTASHNSTPLYSCLHHYGQHTCICFKSGCLPNLLTFRNCTVNLCIRGLAASAGVWPRVTGNDQRRSMESTLHPLLCYLFKCGLSNTTSQNSNSVLHIQFLSA